MGAVAVLALGLVLGPGAGSVALAQDGDLFLGADSVPGAPPAEDAGASASAGRDGDGAGAGGASAAGSGSGAAGSGSAGSAAGGSGMAGAGSAGSIRSGQGGDGPVQARGLVEPRAEALLSSEIAGRLTDLPVEEGARFAAGDVLVAFDCALYEAQLSQAEAAALAARRQLANDRQLLQYNSIGTLEVGLSEAAVLEAQAAVEVAEVVVDRCILTAPYDGILVEHLVEAHESVPEGAELVTIVAAEGAEIDLIVPSAWLRWMAPGQTFDFAVDELGSRHAAEVTRLGARVDPVSQTVRLKGRFVEEPPGLIPGMSGTALFDAPDFDAPGGAPGG